MNSSSDLVDSPTAWRRLGVAVLLSTLGGVGMWSFVVALPAVAAEFGLTRAAASAPFSALMIGFALGGVAMGRWADRAGVMTPVLAAVFALAAGYIASGLSASHLQFTLAHGVLIGFAGASATFGPLLADTSHWFLRRRGLAVAIAASGNYFAGTLWPPVVQTLIDNFGWRHAHIAIGVFCLVTMLPLALMLRQRAPLHDDPTGATAGAVPLRPLGLHPTALQALLIIAGVSCCVAMSMPQVHIVAYCADLGYGAARGAQMLSLMLGFGIVSRLTSGWIADRIGGLATLLLGSALQCIALLLYLPFDGLTSLYVISALFGLFQGGIVPSYAIIVREYFPPREAGARVGTVLMATLAGMALGGWLSGAVFDLTGSYRAAFLNGIGWNLINLSIAGWLLMRARGRPHSGAVAA
ncbi:MAG: MFS transporter [Gemmatimonadota bacterium]